MLNKVLPEQLEEYAAKIDSKKRETLPSDYTLMQLLKSYTGYNAWMAKAARAGSVEKLTNDLDALPSTDENSDPTNIADRASILMKIGRRHVYDASYDQARKTILEAYDMIKASPDAQKVMKDDDYPRLLEWVGMVKHWTYDLDGASACYQECSDLEPINVSEGGQLSTKASMKPSVFRNYLSTSISLQPTLSTCLPSSF